MAPFRFQRGMVRRRCAVRHGERAWNAALLALGMVICTASARADVMDIAPGGATTIYNVPSIFRSEGVQPIRAPRPAVRPRADLYDVPQRMAGSPAGTDVPSLLATAASRYAIRPTLLTAVAWQESHFQPQAVSPKGAVGVMQLMAGTARDLGIDRFDLSQNILGGAAYLRQMMDRFGGNEALALAAYNAGPGAVDQYRGIPDFPETKNYIGTILGGNFSSRLSSTGAPALNRTVIFNQ